MFSFAVTIVAKLIWFCQTFFPSNIVIRRIRRRDGLKWGVPVGLAGAGAYYGLFLVLSTGYEQWGWHEWAHLVGIPVVLSLVKFTVLIPTSVILLASYRVREALLVWQFRRELRSRSRADGGTAPALTVEQRNEVRIWARQVTAPGR